MAAKYWLRTEGIEFEVSKTAVPKTDGKTQKIDMVTQLPLWTVEVTAYDTENQGAQVMPVVMAAASAPEVRWREQVELVDLEIRPWANNRNNNLSSGVSFHASAVHRAKLPAAAA